MKIYTFKMDGSGGDGQTWSTSGTIQCDWPDAFNVAMSHTFEQLTNGQAIFGKPGVGCRGPYDIHRCIIEQAKQ